MCAAGIVQATARPTIRGSRRFCAERTLVRGFTRLLCSQPYFQRRRWERAHPGAGGPYRRPRLRRRRGVGVAAAAPPPVRRSGRQCRCRAVCPSTSITTCTWATSSAPNRWPSGCTRSASSPSHPVSLPWSRLRSDRYRDRRRVSARGCRHVAAADFSAARRDLAARMARTQHGTSAVRHREKDQRAVRQCLRPERVRGVVARHRRRPDRRLAADHRQGGLDGVGAAFDQLTHPTRTARSW